MVAFFVFVFYSYTPRKEQPLSLHKYSTEAFLISYFNIYAVNAVFFFLLFFFFFLGEFVSDTASTLSIGLFTLSSCPFLTKHETKNPLVRSSAGIVRTTQSAKSIKA